MQHLNINGDQYKIIDAIDYITLADSFVKNKIGRGHGEAKLYVGSNKESRDFFAQLESDNCFFLKKDFAQYLRAAEAEYKYPQQDYLKKDCLAEKYMRLLEKLETFPGDNLTFTLEKVDVDPPRIYMRSESDYYEFMRDIALPNFSSVAVLKLSNERQEIFYYFKVFFETYGTTIGYISAEEKNEMDKISKTEMSDRRKKILIFARLGQGKYRENLLKEYHCCPFTLVDDKRLLVASHIKPWVKSEDIEKIDSKNGFIFTPTFDKLFDRGLITFNDDETLVISPFLSSVNRERLKIEDGQKVNNLRLNPKRKKYLEYHRENIFRK